MRRDFGHFLFGAGAFFDLIDNWDFNATSSGVNYQFLSLPPATNADERNTVQNSRFGLTYGTNLAGGSGAAGINQNNGNADTRLISCSFNGGGTTNMRFFTVQGGRLHLDNCHLESGTDAEYWGYVTGSNSSVFLSDWEVFFDTVKTVTAPFYCDSSVVNGSTTFGVGAYNVTTSSVPLVAGTGVVKMLASPDNYLAGNYPAYISSFLNQFADPIFASGAFTRDAWTASGSTPPTVETTNPFSGTKDVKFNMTTGQTNSITSRKFACTPGQRPHVALQMALTGFTTGTVFQVQVQYLYADSSTALAQTVGSLTGNSGYVQIATNGSGGMPVAPPGTTYVQVQVIISGGTTGALGYLGQAIINLPPV